MPSIFCIVLFGVPGTSKSAGDTYYGDFKGIEGADQAR